MKVIFIGMIVFIISGGTFFATYTNDKSDVPLIKSSLGDYKREVKKEPIKPKKASSGPKYTEEGIPIPVNIPKPKLPN